MKKALLLALAPAVIPIGVDAQATDIPAHPLPVPRRGRE